MKEKLIEQIGKELKLATWVDVITVAGAVVVTMVFFAIAGMSAAGAVTQTPDLSGLGGGLFGGLGTQSDPEFSVTATIIMFVALAAIAVINWYAIRVILKNKAERAKLNEGLVRLCKDEGLDQYNDGAIFKTYETRYSLFALITASVAAVSVIVPLVIFIDKLTKL